MISRSLLLTFLLGLSPCAIGEVKADEPATEKSDAAEATTPAAPDSLDDELLKSLGDDEDDAPPPGEKQPATGEAGNDSDAVDDELMRGLNEGEDVGAENPLVKVGRQMREVEKLIGGENSGDETQALQQDIVEQLEKLLKQAQQQQQQQASESKEQQKKNKSQRRQARQPQQQKNQQAKNSKKPSQDSSEKLRPDELERPDKLAVSDLIKRVWGQLPEKEREQMSQHSVELFLPQYEQLITEYFKALVEKQK